MPPRLQEIHPSLVHFPIALMPLSIGADLLGTLTGNRALSQAGKVLMPIAAGAAAISATAGLVAQQEVNAEGVAGDLLVTHRNLNLSLTAISALMAARRLGEEKAGAGYLALGLAGLGVLSYSAYLGGKMTYEHGMGVKPADGLSKGETPALSLGEAPSAAKRAWEDLKEATAVTVADLRAGRIAPALGESFENYESAPPSVGTNPEGHSRDGREHQGGATAGAGARAAAHARGNGGTDNGSADRLADHGAGSPETLP